MDLPQIAEAIVVGVDDAEFGQRIAAAVVLEDVCGPLPPLRSSREGRC
jgi:acyl-coenzyme A synthetase/AMP-(fatty) acid ligase